MELIAALPMYDWPEMRAEIDARWVILRDRLRSEGIAAPDRLVRRNGDMPAVPGGIRDAAGAVIAADPATLPPDELDLPILWRHPALLYAETCWGPMELGLSEHVDVIGQTSYEGIEGGSGEHYSSAIVAAAGQAARPSQHGEAVLPLSLLRGRRFAFNSTDSMSGYLAPNRDLERVGEGLGIFSELVQTGGHRASIRSVAEGRADVAAIDCRSWALALAHEPAAAKLRVIGWTARRKGLPLIRARGLAATRP